MSAESEQAPDPEDGAHTATVFWLLRVCELLVALMFATAMPWRQPFAWFGVIVVLGCVRWWHVNRPRFRAYPKARRRRIYRIYVWVLMAFVGTASYFLYLPGNLPMQAVLAVYVLGTGTLIAVRLTGDIVRTAIALCMAVLPTALRFMVEGVQDDSFVLVLLGAAGVLMTLGMIAMSHAQERNVLRQYELRRRAESAVNAVAAVGLAKSRFFAAVSHDLRQPVHAIGLYLDPLLKLAQASRNEAALHAVEGIWQSWRALDDMLSQVLDLARMDSGAMQASLQPVELAPLVGSLVLQHSAVAESAGVRIVALVKPRRWVLADELMLKRVVSNLLDNAIKFTPPGASVVVALRPAGADWQLQVRDAGMGIAPEAQERIFEEFVQLDNAARDRRRGLGLGLAISRRFVLLMNGTLSLRSALQRGTTIAIRLPRAAAPPSQFDAGGSGAFQLTARKGQPEPAMPSAALAGRELLLVEDDPLVSAAMCQLLHSWGLHVRHVQTAAEAVAQAAFGDLAICDVRLPHNASGMDVALHLRALGKKVLLLSGETDVALREAAQAHGLLLLAKPVSSTGLLQALQDL